MRVKICCIQSVDEAARAIAAGADALGLVGDMPSGPGVIDGDRAREVAAAVPPPIATFLLTQRASAVEIASHVQEVGANTVQIVRHIDPDESRLLAELLPSAVRRVQVIHVEDRSALELIARYASHVHAFLLDSGRPSAATPELGGTGRIHDWSVSAEFVAKSPIPVFLAGGLNAENVAEAVRVVKPYGIDLCSSVRTDDQLDDAKLARFMASVPIFPGG